MQEKQEEMAAKMILADIEFMEANWFKSYDSLIMAWYKIWHKMSTKKTDDWITITATPVLERINSYAED